MSIKNINLRIIVFIVKINYLSEKGIKYTFNAVEESERSIYETQPTGEVLHSTLSSNSSWKLTKIAFLTLLFTPIHSPLNFS